MIRIEEKHSAIAFARFTRDVLQVASQEMQQGCNQVLQSFPKGGEEVEQKRGQHEKLREWAKSEEERLSKKHQLPPPENK